jgi:iron complex outermembrane recepter protein
MKRLYPFTSIRCIVSLSIFCLVNVTVLAQQPHGTINGTITSADGSAAQYVNVVLKGTNKGTTTNADGKFEMRRVAPGTYTLVTSFISFDPMEQTVEVRANETTTLSITLHETSAQLQEVEIHGQHEGYKADRPSPSLRLQSNLMETPQNIQVITRDVLRDQQIISMSDGLIRNVSGVTRAEHWGDMYTNISARGSQLQAFRNGFNIVNSYWGPLTEDMSFVDHIEFVKGPAGFMLSSGDPSGLYNVVTKKPTGITKGEASITAGSYGLFRTTLDLDGKLSADSKLLYRLNLSAQNKNSHRANEYNDRYAIAPVISYQLDDNTRLTLEYIYQRANMSNVGSFYVFSKDGYASLPVDFTSLPAGIPGSVMNDHSIYVNLQHSFNDNWKITGQVARFMYDQIGASMWPNDTTIYQDGTYIRRVSIWDAKSTMTMGQLFVNGEATTGTIRHRVLAGLDIANKKYLADWGQSFGLDTKDEPFDPKNPYLGIPVTGYPEFDRSRPLEQRAQLSGGILEQRYTSIYIQDELGFLDNKLRLTLAGRYTHLEQAAYGGAPDKADHVTPRIGLSASITEQISMYALYDQAFVPQSGVLVSGRKAEPITGNNMEVGVKKDWTGGWNTTLSLYRILKNNEITADPSNPNSGLSIELGQKRAQGIEFDLRGTILPGLTMTANYAYTDSRVTKVAEGVTSPTEGSIVPGFAKHTMNAWLNYQIERGVLKGLGISGGFTKLMNRATYWTPAPSQDKDLQDYFKLDAGIFWKQDNIKITLNVFNVLDDYLYSGSYEDWMYDGPQPWTGGNGQLSPTYSWQTEAPRNFRLSLTYSF